MLFFSVTTIEHCHRWVQIYLHLISRYLGSFYLVFKVIRELGQHERSDDVMFLLAFCRLNCFTYVWEKNNKIRIEDFQYNTSRHRRRKSSTIYSTTDI
ncbi:uncharacterized protein LOC122633029 isoform X2 [Vespula pensylvanica]|uniref:uncharacterized protein LOC122633029 isoform X2 n=1 Tax=Vespula pensylvanica TaxID=30213 RepID=UPI001CBA2E8C|nr:uncharacterized protein LOC122633029 isoform X2 [Vespula pensylvanica]